MILVHFPPQLRSLADDNKCLEIEALSLGDVFRKIDDIAPMIRSQIFDAQGNLRQFVGLFVNEQQVIDLADGSLAVADGSNIAVVMAVAGG